MTRRMYDSTNAADIPTTAQMVAGYLAPSPYAWSAADWARFPHAVKVRIAVRAYTDDGHVLDVESGDATPAQAPGWVQMRRAAGADPTVYCSASAWPTVKAAFAAAHVAEPHWWIAAYPGGGPVIPAGAVAHQYADPLTSGGHYDISAVADHWPGVDEGGDVPLTDADAITIWGYENPKAGDTHDMHQTLRNAEANSAAAVSALAALKTQLTALSGALSSEQAAILAAVKAQPTGATVDVQALAAALAPLLNVDDGAALIAALKSQFEK